MSSLSIPEPIAKHPHIGSSGKMLWAELMSRAKKGDVVETSLNDFEIQLALGGDDIIECLKKLQLHGYALINEEAGGKLTDMVEGQKVILSLVITVETLPVLPMDEASIALRRFGESDDDHHYDQIKIGKRVFTGKVDQFMSEWWLTLRVKEGAEERDLVTKMTFQTLAEAWKFFDEYLAENGETDFFPEVQG
jgi:hypothetical protein